MLFDLEALELMLLIVRPCAVLLSVVTDFGSGWACPISSKVTRYVMARLHPY